MNHDSSSITAGLDLGDRYSHLCLIDTQSGEVIEESRITTSPKALQRRFSGCESMLIALEVGTHSPWVSRLLKDLGHKVLVAKTPVSSGSSTLSGARMTGSTPRTWHVSHG
jgi:transposase